jgi:superfamily I DNA/RNA helicase
LYNWADRFLDLIGYFNELRRAEKSAEASEARIRNVRELMATMDGAGSGAESPYDRLQTFLEEITLDTEREEEDEGPDNAVTLITMHSCKGLEFPHVYIVGLEEGLLPHSRSKEEGTLDEERRLFYVGLTRAMQTLTLSHCRSRKKFGQAVPCHPSRFLNDLPSELVERADEKGKQPVAPESGKKLFDVVREAVG